MCNFLLNWFIHIITFRPVYSTLIDNTCSKDVAVYYETDARIKPQSRKKVKLPLYICSYTYRNNGSGNRCECGKLSLNAQLLFNAILAAFKRDVNQINGLSINYNIASMFDNIIMFKINYTIGNL